MKLPKPSIEDIVISDEKLAECNSKIMLKGSDKYRSRVIRDYVGGNCLYCYKVPSKKVVYDIGEGSKFVEWFCNDCWHKHKGEINTRLQNMNFT